ncbi:MAG: hypothetical protein FJX74_16185 [Armatimonadetes bacterium]|nr:hypothetical protein [Armatimonadota bacterium]
MLVNFPCARCGATLSAHPDCVGETIRCPVCRCPVTVPTVTAPPPVAVRLKRIGPDEEIAEEITTQAYEEARRVAMAEAKRVTLRGRAQGVVVACIGGLAGGFGATALALPSLLWIPRSSGLVTAVFGVLALMIGVTVWRLSVQTMHEEYRRRVPGIADRIRRRRWDSLRATPPPTAPPVAVG